MDPRSLYIDLLIRCIANTIYGDQSQELWEEDHTFRSEMRQDGRDWPSLAHSMIGVKRLENLRNLMQTVLDENVPGGFIETEVWRGAECILMRGLLAANGVQNREVIVADFF